jgi:cyclase
MQEEIRTRSGGWLGPALGLLVGCALGGWLATAFAQPGDDLEFRHLAGNVWLGSGGGGANISVFAGSDGVMLVDSKNPRVTEEILEFSRSVTDGPLRFLVNGHVHPDHTDGNAGLAEAGAIIIAHQAVRDVLLTGQRGGPPAPAAALPILTFPDGGGVSIDFNGETVEIFHVAPAHAPGNSIVWFPDSNVMHVGDLFSPSRYPVIAGGTFEGFIDAMNIAIRMANVDTVVVPGAGAVSDREGMIEYREMLLVVRDRVIEALDSGLTVEDFVATHPTVEYDPVYGDSSHPLFLPVVYEQLFARRQ